MLDSLESIRGKGHPNYVNPPIGGKIKIRAGAGGERVVNLERGSAQPVRTRRNGTAALGSASKNTSRFGGAGVFAYSAS